MIQMEWFLISSNYSMQVLVKKSGQWKWSFISCGFLFFVQMVKIFLLLLLESKVATDISAYCSFVDLKLVGKSWKRLEIIFWNFFFEVWDLSIRQSQWTAFLHRYTTKRSTVFFIFFKLFLDSWDSSVIQGGSELCIEK